MNTVDEFIKIVKEWVALKVPYRHRGYTRSGCDCTGLIIGPLVEMRLDTTVLGRSYKLRNYAVDWCLHNGAGNYIVAELKKWFKEIPLNSTLQDGDILVFDLSGCPSHVGIMTNHKTNTFAHQHRLLSRCSYGSLNNPNWQKRVTNIFRIQSIEEYTRNTTTG